MRKIAILLFSAILINSVTTMAQQQKSIHKTYSSDITPEKLAQARYDHLNSQYQFTEEQKTQIMPILVKFSSIKINAKANNETRTITDIDNQEMSAVMNHFSEAQLQRHRALMSERAEQVEAIKRSRQ